MINPPVLKPDSNDRGIIRFGLIVLTMVFLLGGGWMALAPLSGAVVSIGTVSADMNKKTVQHLEGGIVEELLVKDGDCVKEGQTLLKFQNTNAAAQLDIFKKQYLENLMVEARIESQIAGLDHMKLSEELKLLQNVPEFAEVYSTHKQVFELKQKMLKNDEEITEQRIAQLKKYIEGVSSVIQSRTTRLKSIQEEIGEWKVLFAEQLVDKLKMRELMRDQATLEGDIANAKADIAKSEEQISELRSQLLARKKDFQDKAYTDLVTAKNEIAGLKSKIVAAADTTQRLVVNAPIAGCVVGMEIHTVGGVVQAGKPILDIVPENSQLIVVTRLQTKDIDRVHNGLFADIRFSAFDTRHTQVIEGTVINVSADSFIDQKTGVPYYEAKVALTPKGFEQVKQYNFNLMAGMPAEVMIKTDERTLLNYLVKPLLDMFSRSFNER